MTNSYSLVIFIFWYIVVGASQECSSPPHAIHQYHARTADCCRLKVINSEQEECMKKFIVRWNAYRQSSNKETFDMSDMCASNCFLSNDNVITADNKVNDEAAKIELEKILMGEWGSAIPNMIGICKHRIENISSDEDIKTFLGKCNVTKEIFFECIREQIWINCPDSSWQNGEVCNGIRNYLKNCTFEKRSFGQRGPQ